MATVQGRFSAIREAAQPRTPSLWRVALRQRWFIVISSAFVLLRLPSFVEPTWYSDAGTYADIGWALNRGARLYLDVWDNKPPGIYWLSALLVGHAPIAIAMPLASTLFVGAAAVCVASIARKVGGAGAGTGSARTATSDLAFPGGLTANEELGGHVLQFHVGLDASELSARLVADPRLRIASSFYNRAIAESAIAEAIGANSTDISLWLAGAQQRLVSPAVGLSGAVGLSLTRGSVSPIAASAVRVVLDRSAASPIGYIIRTAYPER